MSKVEASAAISERMLSLSLARNDVLRTLHIALTITVNCQLFVYIAGWFARLKYAIDVTPSSPESIDLINLLSPRHEKNHFIREATAIGKLPRFRESKL